MKSPGSMMNAVKGCLHREMIEVKMAGIELWGFVRTHQWKRSARIAFKRKYWGWWIALAATIALSAVLSSYHNQIITAINPYKVKIRAAKWSWIVPTILLIIVSFPPLFGHELIILAVGVVYGLGIGFAIACLGTFVGELACFYAFRYFLTARAKKIEEKHVAYTCLARLMREGGIRIIILVRFSAVPGHLTTAVQSTVGMSVWIYSIACIVSLPKQFALVYLGVVFGSTAISLKEWQLTHADGIPLSQYYDGRGSESKRHRISLIVFAVTTFATLIAGYIVYMKIRKIRPSVVADIEAKRLARELALKGDSISPSTSEDALPATEMRATRTRPTFVTQNSSFGSQVALLPPPGYGRSRAGTTSSRGTWASSALSSPSLPHLPLSEVELEEGYFDLEKGDGGPLERRGSY